MTTTRLGAACAGILMVIGGAVQAAPISGQGTWETTLQGRDLDGNLATFEAYYDTVLDITWLANANYAGTAMDWAAANAWAASLNPYGSGITGWRLPTVTPINGMNFNTVISNNATTDRGYADADGWVDGLDNPVSEMGHMYYVSLGNLGLCTPNDASPGSCVIQTGAGPTNTGLFSNVQPLRYWSGSALDSSNAWFFSFSSGLQDPGSQGSLQFLAWAVRSGDVSAVPVPAVVWLFGSGLLALLGAGRRQR